MIHVVAIITAKPGKRAEILGHFRANVPTVRAEKGCIEYGPTVDVPTSIPAQGPPRADVVTVVEKWESVAALETHLMAPHMREFRKATESLRCGTSLRILAPA